MNLIVHSIQEYLKRINSRISLITFISLFVTILILLRFIVYILNHKQYPDMSVSYSKKEIQNSNVKIGDSRPFASINGKTYTFDWCQGANMISEKNKIYFSDETFAEKTGRTLSKLCQK